MNNIEFAYPDFFYLLLVLVPMIVWYVIRQNQSTATIQVSTIKPFEDMPKSYRYYLRHLLFVFRIAVITLLIIILARPQTSDSYKNETTEGIDIVIALDISSSMLAEDFQPNRLEASKDVATRFISGRPLDRMGFVVFSGESFTQCPLTTDHAVLINLMQGVKSGMIEDGTAIGLGLANSVSRLKESDAISKVIILLTDGVNNRGEVAPETAAELAKTFGIRVYTIGVGTQGTAPYPVQTPFGMRTQPMAVEIDEAVLKEISQTTGGQYFRATDKNTLISIYEEIDKLEKSKIEVKEFESKQEEYLIFALWAAGLLLLEILLRNTLLRNIP